MSQEENTKLLERAQETLELAREHAEFWTGTTTGKVLDKLMAQCVKNIKNNNLEDLFNINLPNLEETIKSSAREMWRQSQEAFYGYDLIGERDTH